MDTPNEILSRRIAERLAQCDLVIDTRQSSLTARLAAGSMTSADWKVEVQPRPEAEEDGDAE